jgi:hypothetical protein
MFRKRSSTLRAILFALIVSLLPVGAGIDRELGSNASIAKRPPARSAAIENQFDGVTLLPIARVAAGTDVSDALREEANTGILPGAGHSADGLSVPASSRGARPPLLPTPPPATP